MTNDLLIALATFALVSSITPGPNNLMLMASGANFGFRRTMPHMLGVAIGFVVMLVLAGAGLSRIFELWPLAHQALKLVCLSYLAWLAWKIATAHAPKDTADTAVARPMTFLQAAAFQWVNPKGWAMALTAIAVYTPSSTPGTLIAVALVFGAINLPSVSLWAALGQGLRHVLTSPLRLRLFNTAMAALLIASTLPMIL